MKSSWNTNNSPPSSASTDTLTLILELCNPLNSFLFLPLRQLLPVANLGLHHKIMLPFKHFFLSPYGSTTHNHQCKLQVSPASLTCMEPNHDESIQPSSHWNLGNFCHFDDSSMPPKPILPPWDGQLIQLLWPQVFLEQVIWSCWLALMWSPHLLNSALYPKPSSSWQLLAPGWDYPKSFPLLSKHLT